jgi:hypothetical protein
LSEAIEYPERVERIFTLSFTEKKNEFHREKSSVKLIFFSVKLSVILIRTI